VTQLPLQRFFVESICVENTEGIDIQRIELIQQQFSRSWQLLVN
jgi:hypothetical protein